MITIQTKTLLSTFIGRIAASETTRNHAQQRKIHCKLRVAGCPYQKYYYLCIVRPCCPCPMAYFRVIVFLSPFLSGGNAFHKITYIFQSIEKISSESCGLQVAFCSSLKMQPEFSLKNTFWGSWLLTVYMSTRLK